MNIVKKIRAFILAALIAVPVFAVPAFATVTGVYRDYFGKFPGVWQSSQYAVATVAVQKFLMLYGDSYAQQLMPSGGADGYCGTKTVEMIKKFQRETGVHGTSDSNYGRVDTSTWLKMADNLDKEDAGGDTGGCIFTRFNRSYYTLDLKVIAFSGQGFYAYDHYGDITDYPFYSL